MGRVDAFDCDVLVVGSGPTGSTLALALATYGIRVHVVTRSRWLADTPRAHITNQRAMEVFRDLGILDDVLKEATPWDQMGDTLFTTSLAGEELARVRTWGTGDSRKGDYLRASPCGLVDLIQPRLEPILVGTAAERGATFAFNTEYVEHLQDSEGVTVKLRDRVNGQDYALRAKYLFGADGGRSKIVEQLGLPVEGHLARAAHVYTTFEADLSRFVQHRPSILNFIAARHASFGEIGLGLLRAVKPWTHWIAGWGFDMSKGEPDTSESTLRSAIYAMIGDESVEITLGKTSTWYVNQAYISQYSQGRVLCGGDAVHRHPPSSGLGMNTCVQDAFNLAWKLAFVLRGHAGPDLLDSYSAERAPIGQQVVLRANQSRLDYAPLTACFRVAGDPDPINAGIARLKDPGPDGVVARRSLREALDLKEFEFNALGVELNQRYDSSAILPEDGTVPEVFARDRELYLQATTRPGAKLPHVWLVDHRGHRISTLDLVGKGAFTLLTGPSGTCWLKAAEALSCEFLRTVVIGTGHANDVYCDWQRAREIGEDGALLVRPDGFVAWRANASDLTPTEAREILSEALGRILSRPPSSEAGFDRQEVAALSDA
jgi:2,4-dichlorophenol 6-monooxygenase